MAESFQERRDGRLAVYAITSDDAGGRRHTERSDSLRDPFELDRHRIIECTAFRRLEGKTQVFAPGFHDHFRTRLTHSLEVASIARTLARMLGANELLAEAIALAHDLGHPPFGHAGEAALHEAMADHGGFNHNAHSLRVVEILEHPFPPFRGLNLTTATRDGLASHQTRYDQPADRSCGDDSESAAEGAQSPFANPSVEAQIASLADRIAYGLHDLEDAIGAGFVGLPELRGIALWRDAWDAIPLHPGATSIHAMRRPVLDTMLTALLADVFDASNAGLQSVRSVSDVNVCKVPLVVFSTEQETRIAQLEAFLAERVYRHHVVATADDDGWRAVTALFQTYTRDPSRMPPRFTARVNDQGTERVVCDYIAGMTDRFCRMAHEKL